jgi:PAS domain S-box-containing protein
MTLKEVPDSSECSGSPKVQDQVSHAFLQSVIDAFPDSLTVIDRDHSVVLANRKAREVFGLPDPDSNDFKCYEAHQRKSPCTGENEPCPLREVIATKAPVRVYHRHLAPEGKELAVAVDAAPVFDDQGEVVQIVESCRDVTESVVARRLLRIGNRHMQLGPLLEEAALTLKTFTGCAHVGIRIRDGSNGGMFVCSCGRPSEEAAEQYSLDGGEHDLCRCMKIIDEDAIARLSADAKGVTFYEDCSKQLLAAMSSEDDDTVNDACQSCTCSSLALVPIVVDENFHGLIHFACHRKIARSMASLEALERLATELGTAIQCVRAEEALQAARDELEARVQQRTAELMDTNRTLQDEISERTRLEREILQVAAKEQQRIGEELHDGIGQELTGLSYLAQSLYQKLRDGDSAESHLAGELATSIPRVLGRIREVARGLLPLEVGASDLDSALELLAANVTRQTGISCRFEDGACSEIHNDDVAIQIYRIVQEGIANAVKHADSQNIVVTLKTQGPRIRLEVRDDGNGIRFASGESSGRGLRSMRSRARAIGGSLEVGPTADGGTLVSCVLPRESGNGLDVEGSVK